MNYNFTQPQTKTSAVYRLFVVYQRGSAFIKKIGRRRKTYRGYFCERDKGRSKLMDIYLNRINDIELAILYNDKEKTKKVLTIN